MKSISTSLILSGMIFGPMQAADASFRPYQIPTERTPIGLATKEGLARSCFNFIDRDGRLGGWGKILYTRMLQPNYLHTFTNPRALTKACPRFAQLTDRQKLKAWVWFYAALAHEESSCDPDKFHPTHIEVGQDDFRRLNPTAGHGLWALEKMFAYRESRGPACADISTVEGQAACAIDIMHKRHLKKSGRAIVSGSYWGPVRRYTRQMSHHMRRFENCF
jgi:hypothetical protein